MTCVISSPSTDSGKTTLALLISCWAFSRGIKVQTFKVGPDYLDQQQMSYIGQPTCRNLDIFLSGERWVKNTFYEHSTKYELSIIEGAMGLFDGLGSTHYSSTANVAKLLDLPIVFIVNARGQVASLLPLVQGFKEYDKNLSIKGIVFNNVNSERHKVLIKEVFEKENIEILGFLPSDSNISLNRSNLGLISPLDKDKKIDINYFADFAHRNIDLDAFTKFLLPPEKKNNCIDDIQILSMDNNKPIAITEDKIFHFQYPETREFLEKKGIPLLSWDIFNDQEIPSEAIALIIPGGFPEKYAKHISSCKKSLLSLKEFQKKGFIYAECGGMMILGDSIEDENGNSHEMTGILPFKSKKGKLSVGYRYIRGEEDSFLIKKNQFLKGHEFHYWEIESSLSDLELKNKNHRNKFKSPWSIKSWGSDYIKEGWSNNNIHASWVHLHLPSSLEAFKNFTRTIQK